MEEKYVWVVRHKGDFQKGKVKFSSLRGVRWDDLCGGIRREESTYDLYGYIFCNEVVEGVIGHSGIHGPCPHNIKVLIQKCDNDEEIYNQLAARAGKKPGPKFIKCDAAEQVRELVRNNPGIIATDLYDILAERGIDRHQAENAIRYLRKHKFKDKDGIVTEPYKTTRKLFIRENENEG